MKSKAIVLGANGFIGSACAGELAHRGFDVIGISRSKREAARSNPHIAWRVMDIAMASPGDWNRELAGADVVVNASGALQDGLRDNLRAIHENAVENLVAALKGTSTRYIQISAAGVSEDASTEFFRSKARGDRTIMNSAIDWVILRPTLVIGAQAYGGTALLRASAALPVVGVKIFPEVAVQTVSVQDVAAAVASAASRQIPSGTVADLTEEPSRPLFSAVTMIRSWQGFPAWMGSVTPPAFVVRAIGRIADGLGWLGWRSPLRTTALRALESGITGNTDRWLAAGGMPCRDLATTLADMPSTTQERWFARLYLLLPIAVAGLSLFWMLSGLIGLFNRSTAEAVLLAQGFSGLSATLSVVCGAVFDIVLGLAVLARPWARRSCYGMVAISLGYLAAGTIWVPALWADPLGPFLKVLPVIILALFTAAILEER